MGKLLKHFLTGTYVKCKIYLLQPLSRQPPDLGCLAPFHNSHVPLIMWSCDVKRQNKNFFPFLQDLYTSNLAQWWLRSRGFYSQSCISLCSYSCGHCDVMRQNKNVTSPLPKDLYASDFAQWSLKLKGSH